MPEAVPRVKCESCDAWVYVKTDVTGALHARHDCPARRPLLSPMNPVRGYGFDANTGASTTFTTTITSPATSYGVAP